MKTFFLLLLGNIDNEPTQEQRPLFEFVQLTMQEVEAKVFEAKPRKALGDDRLPAEVWKQLWPVVKERVLLLF